MIDISQYKDVFVNEVEEHIQKLNDNLLILEKDPGNKRVLEDLMRSSHTIKGSSATMEFKQMAYLTHVMEDVFDYARNDILKITPEIINTLFNTVDFLEKSLMAIKHDGKEMSVDEQTQALKALSGVKTEGIGKSKRDTAGKPLSAVRNGLGTEVVTAATPVAPREEAVETFAKIDYIKVPVGRLDALMDLMEELLIDKMRLELLKKNDPKLEAAVDHLSRLVTDIQYQVMAARLVPVDYIFARFPRMMRDLAEGEKKDIKFVMTGGEIELDRTIVDKLGEPVMHLLRNAVDHGIAERGKISLRATREKDYATISVENEGVNINFEKIKALAIKKGIVGEKDIEALNSDQLIELFLRHPFSTQEVITETSGRGIGLGIVKNFIDRVGGRISIESPLPTGDGARFTLELPLTIAIINALLIQVADDVFAIPFSNIDRSVTLTNGEIKSMADQDVAVVDGQNVPLIRLHKLFKLKNHAPRTNTTVVLVKRGKDIAGIVVDGLVNRQEIIIKPLPNALRTVKGFSGTTILGDGKTVLILDIGGLLADSKKFIRT